jgi:hypothetical protein
MQDPPDPPDPPSNVRRNGDMVRHQCRVAAFVFACAKKKRIIFRLALGPRASVYEPLGLPPDQARPAPAGPIVQGLL